MISEPCPCCHAAGRVEALDTSFSKIEREICRRLVSCVGLSQLFCPICSVQFQLVNNSATGIKHLWHSYYIYYVHPAKKFRKK
jgi:hypothetical protein